MVPLRKKVVKYGTPKPSLRIHGSTGRHAGPCNLVVVQVMHHLKGAGHVGHNAEDGLGVVRQTLNSKIPQSCCGAEASELL